MKEYYRNFSSQRRLQSYFSSDKPKNKSQKVMTIEGLDEKNHGIGVAIVIVHWIY